MSLARRVADHTFLSLRDAPPAYTAGKVIGVNPEADGLELVSGTPAAADIRPRHYRTPFDSENAGQLLITLGNFTVWRNIFTLALAQPLIAGDVISVEAQAEARNGAPYNTEFATILFLSNSPSLSAGTTLNPGDVMFGEVTGHNVDAAMHYFDTPKLGAIKLISDFETPYIHYRLRCRSSSATGADYAEILRGLGHVSALVWPKP